MFRCYIFIIDLTPGFNWLHNNNYKTEREKFKLWDLVRFILDTYFVAHKLLFDGLRKRPSKEFATSDIVNTKSNR